MIHTFTLHGFYIVLDVHSGAVHVVDELSYRVVQTLAAPLTPICPKETLAVLTQEGFEGQDILAVYEELYSLYQDGLLFSQDSYAPFAAALGPAPIKSMCLNVSHDCNLRCSYCFAAQGDFGHGRKLMSFETGKAAIDFMLKHSGGRHNLEVDFFGGEPLMNFEVVKQIITYARHVEQEYQKNFRFTITTNGLQLDDEKIEYINREMSNVVLSLDGRKEVNDRLRIRTNGSGCYDSIVPKYQKLVAGRGEKDYFVRGTFTRENLDFSKDVLHMYEIGFPKLSIEPVVAPESEAYALTADLLPAIEAEYEKLASILVEKKKRGENIHFFHFQLDLDQGPCAIKRLRGCSCGNEYVAVTPEGVIYPCHQFIGMEEWKMGSVLQQSLDMEKKAVFSHSHIYNKPECMQCWAKFYCSGGCNANNYQYMQSITTPHELSCALEKKRLECAIMMQAALCD